MAALIVVALIASRPAAAKAAQFQNISSRAYVSQGEAALIGGFIVTGQMPKKVILRALGPSLQLADGAALLPDPVLELHLPDGAVVTNDNWRDTQEEDIGATVLAPMNDQESAIVVTLPAGAYTLVLRGKGTSDGSFGNALVEVYDLDGAADSILANISSRGFTGGGRNELVGGITQGAVGVGGLEVVVRALGPSLTDEGVANALSDPTLEIYNSDGESIGFSDNWVDESDAEELTNLGLSPTDNREAALVGDLAPGLYTIVVRGTGVELDLTGIALVEAYHVQ